MRVVRVLERILTAIPIMLGVAVIVFVFMRLTPGDPVDIMMGEAGYISEGEIENIRREFNLDKPIHVQLYLFLANAVRGDFGNSYTQRQPVSSLIAERLPATIELALGASIFALVVAIPIGVISSVKQYSWIDRVGMAGAFVGISAPRFWIGITMILVISMYLKLLPVQGRIDYQAELTRVTGFYVLDSILTGNREALVSSLRHLVLPSITLGVGMAATVARVLRSSMLEVLRQDYITLARAKGQMESLVIVKHALRNALLPTVTIMGLQIGSLLSGNMIVETVFAWPGLGRLVVAAIFARDFPLVQGTVMVYALIFIIANLIVDVLYTYLNPRIDL
jgi:peptide/nickel transport system permease protein